MPLIKEELHTLLKGDIIGKEIIFYEKTSSTNDRAMEIGKSAAEGTVIIAETQENGRGRFDRVWVSPPHVNLYFTVLLKPPFLPKEATLITFMAAVAVVSAIQEYTGLNAVIKWPNDILIRGKKVGGILTEMKSDMERIEYLSLGIGINVNMPLNMLPEKVRSFATSLSTEKGYDIIRVELLGAILFKLEYWYKNLLRGERKALLHEWLNLDSTIGKKVSVKVHDRVVSGTAEGISDEGELIVRLPSGDVEKMRAGEVTILKTNNH